MARAARLPSSTASTTSRPPLTQSPPTKYFELVVWLVSGDSHALVPELNALALLEQGNQARLSERGDHHVGRQSARGAGNRLREAASAGIR